jgi:hypothetical protein
MVRLWPGLIVNSGLKVPGDDDTVSSQKSPTLEEAPGSNVAVSAFTVNVAVPVVVSGFVNPSVAAGACAPDHRPGDSDPALVVTVSDGVVDPPVLPGVNDATSGSAPSSNSPRSNVIGIVDVADAASSVVSVGTSHSGASEVAGSGTATSLVFSPISG